MTKAQVEKKPASRALTPRQAEALIAFKSVLDHNGGVSPSLEEIAAEMNVSKATAQNLVRRMVANGSLVRRAGTYRSLSLAAAESGQA